MTIFYLFSGLRRNELFGLRGSDIELQEDGLIIKYKRKGEKYQRREVSNSEVRDALIAYLRKSKRLSVFHTGESLWTRHDCASEPGLPLTLLSFAEFVDEIYELTDAQMGYRFFKNLPKIGSAQILPDPTA